jgi:SWI/SNF-related matrix-associated actin-dependent regulator of chromatin subfamily A-like protein 1
MIRLIKQDPSRAITSNITVPAPEGCVYDPYQLAAVEYSRPRIDTLIGDEPGTGKSIEALGIANDRQSGLVLIICPGFLKPKWRREAKKWLVLGPLMDIDYVPDGKPAEFGNVVIINYELLKKHREHLREIEWDLLIVDECHKLKNKKADRTREVFGGVERNFEGKITAKVSKIQAARRIFMSGTPVMNGKPKELWPLLQSIDPDGLGADWYRFAKRYCQLEELFIMEGGKKKHLGWKWDGCENEDELQETMRQRFMIRRMKSQVLTQLPAKQRTVTPICTEKSNIGKLIKKEQLLFEEWARGRKLEDIEEMPEFGEFAEAMHQVGLSMVEPTIEIAEHNLELLDKLAVVCYHKDVAEKIAAHFGESAILITGDVPQEQRDELSEEFQTNPKKRVIVGTEKSCGEGLDWYVAKKMLVAERCWEPGAMTQVEDRIHRRGQTESVQIEHIVREGSLGDHQAQIMIRKQDKNDSILDKRKVSGRFN